MNSARRCRASASASTSWSARPDETLKAELRADIAELDKLIDEILLASRLNAVPARASTEAIDLQALAAEECARYDDCELDGDHAWSSTGDPRLLRRLIRNLLENAEQHGKPPVRVTTGKGAETVTLSVEDAGDGISPADRDRIFTPFTRVAGDEAVPGSACRWCARSPGSMAATPSSPTTRRPDGRVRGDLPAKS